MRWEAANVKKRTRSEDERHDDSNPKSSETVEAALARLTKAYSAAMACIGSLHRVASLPENDEILQRVADAARTTLEHVVLIDPYDRLERHALERGRTALPPDVPPNRLVL